MRSSYELPNGCTAVWNETGLTIIRNAAGITVVVMEARAWNALVSAREHSIQQQQSKKEGTC